MSETKRLSAAELDAIGKRASQATEGEWYVAKGHSVYNDGDIINNDGYVLSSYATYDMSDSYLTIEDKDAEFIAHARSDVPALLAEVERLQEVECELEDKLHEEQCEFLEMNLRRNMALNALRKIVDGEADSLGDAFQIAKEALEYDRKKASEN